MNSESQTDNPATETAIESAVNEIPRSILVPVVIIIVAMAVRIFHGIDYQGLPYQVALEYLQHPVTHKLFFYGFAIIEIIVALFLLAGLPGARLLVLWAVGFNMTVSMLGMIGLLEEWGGLSHSIDKQDIFMVVIFACLLHPSARQYCEERKKDYWDSESED